MPELPEVEAARLAIEDHCVGKKIKKAIVADDPKVIDGVLPRNFEASLVGKTIISGHRKGKNMWLQLDSPPFPSFQFGMAGAIYIKGVAVTKYKRSAVNDADEWPSKYSKIFIELEDGLELSFTDKRRFARVRLLNDPASEPPISDLGPDAFLEPMALDEFMDLLMKKNIAIKTVLLDQSCISGIGNWVADEVLYQARIHPLQTASSLSRESCTTLQECIKEVIKKAIEVKADASQFPSNWIFHSREKKPGKAFVDGKEIDFISAGGRTTAYVPELQKLSGKQVVKASAKPRNRTSKNSKDIDKEGANEEENTDYAKSEKGQKAKGARKRPPAKNKSKVGETEDGGGNAEADEEEGGGDAEAGKEEGDGDEDQKKKSRAGSRKRQTRAVKSSNKKAKVSQKSEKPWKKGK